MRITTVPLETKLLAQLDKHSPKLLEVIRRKGGAVRQKTSGVLQLLDEVSMKGFLVSGIHAEYLFLFCLWLYLIPFFLNQTLDIDARRECIITALMIYLGEPVEHLIKEYQVRASQSHIEKGLKPRVQKVFYTVCLFHKNSWCK